MADGDASKSQGDTGAFLASITDEGIRGNELLKDFKDSDSIAKSYIDLSKSFNDNKVTLEQLQSTVPVVPEKPDGYQVEIPKEVKEGGYFNEDDYSVFKTFAHENKLSNDQFQKIVAFDFARQKSVMDKFQKIHDEAVAGLKKEYGDKYDANLALAQKVLAAAGQKELAKRVDLGNDPGMFKLLVWVGQHISEDKLIATEEYGGDADTRPKDPDTKKPMLEFKDM